VAFGKALAWSRGIPIVPVHHLPGTSSRSTLAHGELPLPSAVLVVSGGTPASTSSTPATIS
jgi:tRNA A37 threonylcarbamoyltransferase TsaD